MMAMPRTGIVLPLDPGSNLNNVQSHNSESTLKSLELKIFAFGVAEIIILRKSATRIATHSSAVPVRDLNTLRKCLPSLFDVKSKASTTKPEFTNYVCDKEALDYYGGERDCRSFSKPGNNIARL
jgi:hypothetical protein